MIVHRLVSALLGYPDAALRAALPELAEVLATAEELKGEERAVIGRFVAALAARDPIAVEEDYVRTFDMVPEHSLHLTHHLLGEDRNRGPALIDLGEFYREHGVEVAGNELPDYLPLVLEFASLLDADAAKFFLSRWNRVLRQLAANLEAGGSPYAELVYLVEARSRVVAAADPVTGVAAAVRSDPCSDDGDFDPPVSWDAPVACSAAFIPTSAAGPARTSC